MKMEDARKLEKGARVCWSLGNGWYQKGTFQRLMKVTRFKRITFDDLMTGNFSLNNGRDEIMACVKYLDDDGRERETTISVRKMQIQTEGVIWINGKAR